ncbi:MAG: aminotransferase IV [Bacteroidales bacterium]|nr:MAG: aminotransferase IV [Bacteroidales bacterium]
MDHKIRLTENFFALNGAIKPIEDFQYQFPENAPIVYEVIRVKKSTPLFFNHHIDRLINSTALLSLEIIDKQSIRKQIIELLEANPIEENNIRISLVYSTPTTFDILIYFIPSSYPTQQQRENGVTLRTLNANRNNPNAKVENSTLRELADKIISESGCYEVLLVDSNGLITEGSRSNIFLIKDNTLYTPPLNMVLGGITRQVVLNISASLKILLKEEPLPVDRLTEFDCAFLTGTSPGLLPISLIDNNKFNTINLILFQLINEYNNAIAMDIANLKKIL